MRPEDLNLWNRAIPFVPYRIRLNSGKTYEIRHPEMIKIGRTSAILFTFLGDPLDPFEKGEMISLLLIEQIEPIVATAVV